MKVVMVHVVEVSLFDEKEFTFTIDPSRTQECSSRLADLIGRRKIVGYRVYEKVMPKVAFDAVPKTEQADALLVKEFD